MSRSFAPSEAGKRILEISNLFGSLFAEACRIYRAPGRINLIGEHTDYNQGFVMPAAIQFSCWAAIATTRDRTIEVHSTHFKERRSFHLDHPQTHGDWSDYVQGVALMLEDSGIRLSGARMLISSEVPIGSGLSSSAALEVAAGIALLDTQEKPWSRKQLALACQRAENEFVGVRCGLMDQFIACHGKAGHLMLLDCRSLEHRFLRLPESVRLVICNTMVKHENAAGEYNTRRAECEEGLRVLRRRFPALSSLRNLTLHEFEQSEGLLPRIIWKRCRHVLQENRRVLGAAEALEKEKPDLKRFGELMADSHLSLRDDYEVSSPELDLMVELANQFFGPPTRAGVARGGVEVPGIYGARMTGAGFGGCTVNLVAAEAVTEFQNKMAAGYKARTGIVPEIYVSTACDGAARSDHRE
jgi:galactokinase